MPESTVGLANVIRHHAERILTRFVQETERKLAPTGLTRGLIVDHIPAFLDDVANQLDALDAVRCRRVAVDVRKVAREHGAQRWALGFDLEALIREYEVLRHSIVATAKEVGAAVTIDELDDLASCMSGGMADAAAAYMRERTREVAIERARVEAAARAKDELVAMVSHELRTPLHAIVGWLRLMRAGILDDATKKHALRVIERNAEAQDRLVADLLDISRVITGKLRIEPSRVNLSDLVEIAVEAMRPAADAKEIQLVVELEREPTVVLGDGERLRQVAWNLIANAVKFTPKSGTVRVVLHHIDSEIELLVEDDGEGIDASFLPRVFEVFQQFDRSSSRAHGGLGIGLSIVKHIVDLHGGRITAESAGVGKGARFSVRLPLREQPFSLGASPLAPLMRDPTVLPTGRSDLQVLVIDDDPEARELLAVILETSGIGVRSVATADEALAALDTYTASVVCADIDSPEQADALIRNLRTSEDLRKRRIPVIGVTAPRSAGDRRRVLLAEGFDAHLTSPVEPSALVRTVLVLADRSAEREA